MDSKREFRTIQLGALLHDVGKLLQRGDFGSSLNVSGKHPEVSARFIGLYREAFARWVDVDLLQSLVQRHHEDRRFFPPELLAQEAPVEVRHLCLLVSQADNYSSAEREETQSRSDFKTTPLASVFSRIQLGPSTPPRPHFYPVQAALAAETVFPTTQATLNPSVTAKHVAAFAQELRTLSSILDQDFRTFYHHLLALLEKFAWCLPANTQEAFPDVSLYDHLRTTSAIAAALYQYHADHRDFSAAALRDVTTPKFLLVTGDLSGIQSYLFDVSAIGVGGVAKRLRARSFFLSALSGAVAHKMVHNFDLPPANILSQAGGNFYVLLPNTEHAQTYVKNLQLTLNQDLFINYGGELFFNLVAVPFAGAGFNRYNEVTGQARERLSQAKLQPLAELLQTEDGQWREKAFILPGLGTKSRTYCASCHKLPGTHPFEEGTLLCPICYQDTLAGRWLTRARVIAYYDHEPQDAEKIRLPAGLWAVLAPALPRTPHPLVALQVGTAGTESPTALSALPTLPLHLGNYVPTHNGEVVFFTDLAKRAAGKSLLGIIKADVDNLGALFALGLKDHGSISRVATLSRLLESFFSDWLNHCLAERFPNTYLVYSGGDDLLAVAPWNEAFALAQVLQQEFARFTGHNPDITLSAGIALVKPRQSIARSVAEAEQLLDTAKDTPAKGTETAKNQCAALTEVIKWEHLPQIIKEAEQLATWVKDGLAGHGFLQHLLHYGRLYERYVAGDTSGLKYLPLLYYDIARNLCRPGQEPVYRWASQLLSLESPSIRHLGFIARYAALLLRTKEA